MLFAEVYILHSEELLVDLVASEQMSLCMRSFRPCSHSSARTQTFLTGYRCRHRRLCQEWKVNTLKTQHSTPEEPRQYLTVPPVQLQAHSVKMVAVGKGNTKTLSC